MRGEGCSLQYDTTTGGVITLHRSSQKMLIPKKTSCLHKIPSEVEINTK